MSGDPFVTHRSLLFTVAYEMLGSAVDAEDVVQETWLKWQRVEQADIRDPRAYLVRIVTRTALDQLRTVSRRREEYVGPWLPEPLLTSPDVAEDVELADSLSTAMLLVLETLTPTQRAVFLLHDVFDVGYDELAEAVGQDARPRCGRSRTGRARTWPSAARAGDLARPTPGARSRRSSGRSPPATSRAWSTSSLRTSSLLGDGGGIKQALPRPILGADKVGRLLAAGVATVVGDDRPSWSQVNGWPACCSGWTARSTRS